MMEIKKPILGNISLRRKKKVDYDTSTFIRRDKSKMNYYKGCIMSANPNINKILQLNQEEDKIQVLTKNYDTGELKEKV